MGKIQSIWVHDWVPSTYNIHVWKGQRTHLSSQAKQQLCFGHHPRERHPVLQKEYVTITEKLP